MAMGLNGNQWESMGINGPQTKPYQGGVHHTYKGESSPWLPYCSLGLSWFLLVSLGLVPPPRQSTFYCKNNCVVKPLKTVYPIRLNSTLPNYSDCYLILTSFLLNSQSQNRFLQFRDLFHILDITVHKVIFVDFWGPKGLFFQQI